ncbi:hypothetical protein VTP01DRAFT_8834, partial [Rhizomucor pusillus]|uniref:uncharacterized protein n=1 Tax=Rhizomucor pusillus TaxID=4840 RepID=UPI0037446A7B
MIGRPVKLQLMRKHAELSRSRSSKGLAYGGICALAECEQVTRLIFHSDSIATFKELAGSVPYMMIQPMFDPVHYIMLRPYRTIIFMIT